MHSFFKMRRFARLIQVASRAGVLIGFVGLLLPSSSYVSSKEAWVHSKPTSLLTNRRLQLAQRAELYEENQQQPKLQIAEEHGKFVDPPTRPWKNRIRPKTRPQSRFNQKDPFTRKSPRKGTSGRGAKQHFHLLDRYIRRIDSLVPEDMEDLVRPLNWAPNLNTTSTIKLNFPLAEGDLVNLTEDKVRAFCAPVEPAWICWEQNLTWIREKVGTQVYLRFNSPEEAKEVWEGTAGKELCGERAMVKLFLDDKFREIAEKQGLWEEGFEPRRGTAGQILPPWSQSRNNPKNWPANWPISKGMVALLQRDNQDPPEHLDKKKLSYAWARLCNEEHKDVAGGTATGRPRADGR
mmetsp:Transcript_69298/g.122664  ORF Transcript_69298/g.122664 Transcript_69298/m.122664 type:complete len:350 (-) Transcript_69298:40-1089(-)